MPRPLTRRQFAHWAAACAAMATLGASAVGAQNMQWDKLGARLAVSGSTKA